VPKDLETRSMNVYFGETAKVTNGRSSVKRVAVDQNARG